MRDANRLASYLANAVLQYFNRSLLGDLATYLDYTADPRPEGNSNRGSHQYFPVT
jgi:hypothetical protein